MEQKSEEEPEKYCPQCEVTLPPDAMQCPVCGTLAEIGRPAPTPLPVLIGRSLVTVAGFVSIIGGIVNFGAAAALAWYAPSGVSEDVSRSYGVMILAVFAMAILCFIGSASAWSAGMRPWRKRRLKSIAINITFQAVVGFLTLIEGVMIYNFDTQLGLLLILMIALPTIGFSLPSLVLTAFTESA